MIDQDTYNVKTSTLTCTFRIEKSVSYNSYTQKYNYDMLKVGGRKFCVELKFNREEEAEAELQWLSTKDGGCELYDTPIRDKGTIHLLFLALTILKTYINVKRINFLDNSKYDCTLSDGSKSVIFMNQYYYLFHGGTWYDLKTGAIPKNLDEREKYEEGKALFSKKTQFDFRNPIIEREFRPIYENSRSWREFLDTIYKNKGDNFCQKIIPWYSHATGILANNRLLPGYWILNLENSLYEPIPFTRIVSSGGTRKKTYKIRADRYDVKTPSELYDLRY
jgi:hypothetical protein